MKKVKISKEQAKAIEHWLNTYVGGKEELVKTHITDADWVGETESLNGMPLEKLFIALYIGYELEPSPEEKIKALYKEHIRKDSTAYHLGVACGIQYALDLLNIKIPGVNS